MYVCKSCKQEINVFCDNIRCPHCGARLEFDSFDTLFRYFYDTRWKSKGVSTRYLDDFAPKYKEDIAILRYAADRGVFLDLASGSRAADEEKKRLIQRAADTVGQIYNEKKTHHLICLYTDCLRWEKTLVSEALASPKQEPSAPQPAPASVSVPAPQSGTNTPAPPRQTERRAAQKALRAKQKEEKRRQRWEARHSFLHKLRNTLIFILVLAFLLGALSFLYLIGVLPESWSNFLSQTVFPPLAVSETEMENPAEVLPTETVLEVETYAIQTGLSLSEAEKETIRLIDAGAYRQALELLDANGYTAEDTAYYAACRAAENGDYSVLISELGYTSVTVSVTAREIKANAFSGTQDRAYVQCITIPEGITTLRTDAFAGCCDLSTLTLPSTLKKIERGFFPCGDVNTVLYFHGTKGQWKQVEREVGWNENSPFSEVRCTTAPLT